MLREDPRNFAPVRHDKARARWARGNRGETGPPDPCAPKRGHAPIGHHERSIGGLVEIKRLEIAIGIKAKTVDYGAAKDREAGAFRPERDCPSLEIANR